MHFATGSEANERKGRARSNVRRFAVVARIGNGKDRPIEIRGSRLNSRRKRVGTTCSGNPRSMVSPVVGLALEKFSNEHAIFVLDFRRRTIGRSGRYHRRQHVATTRHGLWSIQFHPLERSHFRLHHRYFRLDEKSHGIAVRTSGFVLRISTSFGLSQILHQPRSALSPRLHHGKIHVSDLDSATNSPGLFGSFTSCLVGQTRDANIGAAFRNDLREETVAHRGRSFAPREFSLPGRRLESSSDAMAQKLHKQAPQEFVESQDSSDEASNASANN